ncbi:SET domain-containing protein 4 [Echinococcus granulosus]|uniref:SET trithorax:polycomb domain containing protein n=1 Tax=Echinococcus granulosus TaxID=6210 RepID=A0A068WYW1_ECHGR|nr:SET domain-containing protein 4 [Echinococcus granulosus]CDS22856.1 SET trithorax:polycomb domain containing protein [Echinococcus granulosus]
MSQQAQFLKWFEELNHGAGDPGTLGLEISDTVATGGRGLVARKSLPSSDSYLLSIKVDDPRLVLTPRRSHYLLNQCSCGFDEFWKPTVNVTVQDPQDVLVLFFFHLKFSHQNPKCYLWCLWQAYFDILPKSFADIAYVSIESPKMVSKLHPLLPKPLVIAFESQIERMRRSYRRLFANLASFDPPLDFAWAWSVVNSRCVYVNLRLWGGNKSTLPHICDSEPRFFYRSNENIAIIPFFDLFNHSPDVSVSIEVTNGVLKVKTDSSYQAGEQVFINYGKHDNLFLLCEYGFCIPGVKNPCDVIYPTFGNLLSISGSIQKLNLILSTFRLPSTGDDATWKSVYLTIEGPSYYLALILFALFTSDETIPPLGVLYSLDEDDRSPSVQRGLRLLLNCLLEETERALESVTALDCHHAFIDLLITLLASRRDLLKSTR